MSCIGERLMKPEERSKNLLAITRSKAKMYEYGLPEREHIEVRRDPALLLRLAVGMLGDLAAAVSRTETEAARMAELSSSLRFSARYFDAYAASKLAENSEPYLLLLASAAYYLCDLPGSAAVLVSNLHPNEINLEAGALDRLLCWLLRGEFASALEMGRETRYRDGIMLVSRGMSEYFEAGIQEDGVLQAAAGLRQSAINEGTPRDLLLADACCAIVTRRIENSARRALPQYSGLPLQDWEPALGKASFVRELWPSQRLLGQREVFAGASAVVQMPTSAGKSRATEIVIRSAFLSGRASLAVVVAPYRALCREISEGLERAFRGEEVDVNELSDVIQKDFEVDDLGVGRRIVVLTPEKLAYVLRHAPELAGWIGLLVLDEGHQFDAGTRGVTYELLVTSLLAMIPLETQKLLISAVISNSSEIGTWLNGDQGIVVAGSSLLPTERSVAFASWRTQYGQLRFVKPEDPDQEEFFVPRVIKSLELGLRGRERKPRFFPTKDNSQSVALYLGLRLIANGAVAVFCGRKDTATGLCETVVDIFDRGLEMQPPLETSDAKETERLANLYERNLGPESAATRAARIGVFSHHGNTPHGVRLAVEHAMKEGHGRFVLCTSTLAQGVNLPIRYLIVTTARQGGEKIRVRDFHNLMGRAGRSGMHTEGSVLFANPEVYDERRRASGRWLEFKLLLQVGNAEPCASTLLSVLGPLRSDGGQVQMPIDPLEIAQRYVDDSEGTRGWINEMAGALARQWFSQDTLVRQLRDRRDILASIESFLLAHWQEAADHSGLHADPVRELAKQTLAYHLASSEQRVQLINLFALLAEHLVARVTDSNRRQVYGRTLFGVGDIIALEQWVSANTERIAGCEDEEQLFDVVWKCIEARIQNGTFLKWSPAETRESIARGWIAGESFGHLHDRMVGADARIGLGARPRKPKVEHLVELGENALGFDGALILGAVTELYGLLCPNDEARVSMLQSLQKRLKHGLPSGSATLAYDAGCSDRALAMELAGLAPSVSSRAGMIAAWSRQPDAVADVFAKYPQYFGQVLDRLLG
jgi:DEAD/DEAH box helicase/Helicase conserved C-terminal domain